MLHNNERLFLIYLQMRKLTVVFVFKVFFRILALFFFSNSRDIFEGMTDTINTHGFFKKNKLIIQHTHTLYLTEEKAPGKERARKKKGGKKQHTKLNIQYS